MSDPDLTIFRQKLAERRAAEEERRRQAQKDNQSDQLRFDPDLIPSDEFERSEEDRAMDRLIDGIDIIDAYNKWCGKMKPKVGTKTEGIKISCPVPGHLDKNPSAWINTDKQTWFCAACDMGGDSHDIAAFHFGFPVPGYKEGSSFHELRQKMAEDFGYVFVKMPGNVTVVTAPEPESGESEVEEPSAEVIELYDDSDLDFLIPDLDWRKVVPKDTFLDAYMKATTLDDVPEEYHFWNGLLALGFALGRDVRLFDLVPVYGNLFICTLGHSGSGKSKARYHLDKLLSEALPHDWSNPNSKGVRKISSPGSAEVLIHNFQKPVPDPSDPKRVAYYAPVRGIVDYNELSALMARVNRQGSAIVPALMQFYDMEGTISTSSMTHGSKEAHEPFASALTTTQPKALKDLLSRENASSGFLNRWVFVPGKEKQRFAIGGVRVDMTPAVKPLQDILGWAGSFMADEFMDWSDDAAKRFTEFFHMQIEPDKKRNSASDMVTRIDLVMKKLVLLFTANRMLKTVPVESVEAAIECYTYLIESYGIPAEKIGSTFTSEVSEAILYQAKKEWERNKRGVTLNNIARSLKRRKYPNDLLIKSCESLVKLGFLQVEAPAKGAVGRPTVRYKYVD